MPRPSSDPAATGSARYSDSRSKWKDSAQIPGPASHPGRCTAPSDLVPERRLDHLDGVNQPGPEDPDGIPYIRGQDLQEAFLILEDQLRKTSRSVAERHTRSTLATGDALLAIHSCETRVALVPPSLAGANITQGTVRIRPRDGIHAPYLAHLAFRVVSPEVGCIRRCAASTCRGLDVKDETPQSPTPGYEEQVRIAEKLDAIMRRAQRREGHQLLACNTCLILSSNGLHHLHMASKP